MRAEWCKMNLTILPTFRGTLFTMRHHVLSSSIFVVFFMNLKTLQIHLIKFCFLFDSQLEKAFGKYSSCSEFSWLQNTLKKKFFYVFCNQLLKFAAWNIYWLTLSLPTSTTRCSSPIVCRVCICIDSQAQQIFHVSNE